MTRTRTITYTNTPRPTDTLYPTWPPTLYLSHTPRPTASPTQTITSTFNPYQDTLTIESGTEGSPTTTPLNYTPGPDEGYPVNTTQTLENTNPGETQINVSGSTTPQASSSGYPVSTRTQTPGKSPLSTPTRLGKKLTIHPLFLGTRGIIFWIFGLAGGLLAIFLVTLSGWILFKRRIS
jgi:hypothetical protein